MPMVRLARVQTKALEQWLKTGAGWNYETHLLLAKLFDIGPFIAFGDELEKTFVICTGTSSR